jgi:hypothetical protein
MDTALDYGRPLLAWSQPDIQPAADDLTLTFAIIRNALAVIRQCLRIAIGILWRRFAEWVDAKVLRSLATSWVLCGIGWGGFIGFAVLQYFTR